MIIQKDKESAKQEISLIYKGASEPVVAAKIMNTIKKTCQKTTSKITLKEAFTARMYRNGTGVAVVVMLFHQLTGMGCILFYSNTIFAEMPSGLLTPRQGTYAIGIFNLIASMVSLYTAKRFSRRFLFIGGNISMAMAMYLFSMLIIIEKPTYALGALFLFLFCFQNSTGCITWLYCSEVAVDVSLGMVGVFGYFTTFVVSLTTQPLINSKLNVAGTFIMFATITLIGGIWMYFFMKETSGGLTDKQKKSLYIPKDLQEFSNIREDENTNLLASVTSVEDIKLGVSLRSEK